MKLAIKPGFWPCLLFLASFAGLAKGLLGQDGRWVFLLPDLCLVSLFIVTLVRSQRRALLEWISLALGIYMLARTLDSNIATFEAAYQGIRKTCFFLFALAIGVHFRSIGVEQLVKVIKAVGAVMFVFALKQYFFWGDFDQRLMEANTADYYTFVFAGRPRSVGLFSSPFTLGALGALLCGIAASRERRPILLLCVGFVLVLCSMTRTNGVAAMAAVLFSFMWRKLPPQSRAYGVVMVGALLCVLPLLMLDISAQDAYSFDSRLYNRTGSLEAAIGAFRAEPFRLLFGFGTGSAGDALAAQFVQGYHITSHNVFLKFLFEGGLIGLAGFVTLLCVAFRYAFVLKGRECALLIAALTVLVINGLVGSAVEMYPVNLFIGLLVGAIYANHAQRSDTKRQEA